MVEEMHLCIEAIVAKTAEEGITLDEMALNGFSAGGCLALLFAYRETPELPLKFVIEQSAPTTFDPKEWEEGVHWFVTHTTGVNGSAEGDTLVIPTNGGRIIESNVYLKLLSFDESTDDADLLLYGINNGVWENLGYFFTDWAFYGNHGYDWNRTNIIDQMNTQQYEQIAIVYSGHGTIWALDDWDYTTTQATTMEFLIEDRVVNDTVYDVTGLNPADDHYYFVKARNSQYTSEKSESVECFGLAAPTMHEATGITEDSYTANWEAHPKADKYLLYNYYVYTAYQTEQDHVILYEDFSNVTSSATPDNPEFLGNYYSMNLDEYTSTPDWWAYNTILANGMLGAGCDQIANGALRTPEIRLDNDATFRVKVTMYGEEGAIVRVDASADTKEVQFTETGLQTFSLEFATGSESAHERLSFHSLSWANFLIDNIIVTQNLDAGEQAYQLFGWQQLSGEVESATFDDLEQYNHTDFAYDIVAVHNAFGNEYKSIHSELIHVSKPLEVKESDDNQLVDVYPNPANEKVVFNCEVESVSVYNAKGQLVRNLQHVTEIDMATLPNGLYLLNITTDKTSNSHITKKMVVKHAY
jgi:hypothetical protein